MNNLTPFENSTYRIARYHHYATMYVTGGLVVGVLLYKKVNPILALGLGIGSAILVGKLDPVGFNELKKSIQ
jgi:hypothetical protein